MAARLLVLLAIAATLLPGQQLLVAAAADLSPLEDALRQELEPRLGVRVRFSFGSSGMLANQIRNGAPFDVYLSANEQFVDDLKREDRLLPETVRSYATGRLGLWSAPNRVRTFKQLAEPWVRHIAIPNPQHAPYGAAAKAYLQKENLWKQVEPKLVLAENVRQAFEFARTGNADAVLTSWTLLFDKGGILLPVDSHPPIRQSGGVVRGSSQIRAATALLDYLTSAEGRKLLARFGLFPPPSRP